MRNHLFFFVLIAGVHKLMIIHHISGLKVCTSTFWALKMRQKIHPWVDLGSFGIVNTALWGLENSVP